MVLPDYRGKMSPPSREKPEETEEYLNAVRQALTDGSSGYQWIASLFGMAFDTRGKGDDLSNAGRLSVETMPFDHATPQPIAVNGRLVDEGGLAGPRNARPQMAVRNPLDRVTHTSKEGGLHHFLEFCKGEVFEARLRVLNPRGSDLGLIYLWRQEIDAGLLRLGALSSIGRGRVSIEKNSESYELWLGPGAPEFNKLAKAQPNSALSPEDALSGLWKAYSLPPERLAEFVTDLQEEA